MGEELGTGMVHGGADAPESVLRGRPELVRQWTREIMGTSYVPMSRQRVQEMLDECLGALAEALRTDPFSDSAGDDVGARLVRNHFTGTAALHNTVRLLAAELPRRVVAPFADDELRSRTIALLGGLSAGYGAQLRQRTLGEQEVIKQAVLEARDAAESALQASETRFRTVFTASALGIAIVRLDGTVEDSNASMASIFRATSEELAGRSIFELADAGYVTELDTLDAELAAGERASEGDQFQLATLFTTPEGEQVWTQVSASLVRDTAGAPEYQVVLYEDVTTQHMLEERLRHQALHDPLTGLANRTQLKNRMEEALAPLVPGRRVALCYLDLDGFKTINDSLGHPIGDDLLRVVAKRIQAVAAGESGTAARMGGDEFVVLVPDTTGPKPVVDMVEQLLREITTPVRIGDHELNASASIGVVECAVRETGPDDLLRDADITLYRAKTEGKAQWVLFDPELNATARERFRLSATLPAALDEHEFFVEYEPVVRFGSGQVVAVEARVRWDHPEFGELGPADFLPLAEDTGIVVRLGKWILRQVCEHATSWQDRFGDRAPLVSVDLATRQCRDAELVADVQSILNETGIKPDHLQLELTEGSLFDTEGDSLDSLSIFSEMGLRLVLGEFSGGYGSVARLRQLPLGGVKISGSVLDSFDVESGPDPVDEQLVTSQITLAHMLGLNVMVDGVRTELQAGRLRELGADAGQGPHFGELASALEIEAMVANGTYRLR